MGEHFPYKEGVTGSSPVPPITGTEPNERLAGKYSHPQAEHRPNAWIRDRRSPEQISEEFWTEQRALRERREEIAAMPRGLERFSAILSDIWTADNLEAMLTDGPLLFRSDPEALDQWLAEDGRVREVAEGLGL